MTLTNHNSLSIAHFVHRYLFITGSWIYHQLLKMTKYCPFVLTPELENLEQFPFAAVYCYNYPFKGNNRWQIALRESYEALTNGRERYYKNVIKSKNTVLLHAHFGTEGFYHLGIKKKTKLPLVTTFYGADVSKMPQIRPRWLKRYQRLFDIGSLFLAEGPYMAQAIVDLGCPPHKVLVQHLGIDLQKIEFLPRFRSNKKPVQILMACSFREKKGIPFGIEAFARAIRKFPEMELRIIGGAKSLEEKNFMEKCKNIARLEGVAEKVHFLGYLSYNHYLKESNAAHIFLAPSIKSSDGDTEGGAPVSIIEASASGMPIISTQHCDIPNVVIDRKSGILVPERDIGLLSNAILEIATDPEIWPEMGEIGRSHIEKEFDIFKQISRMEEIYDKLIS